MMHAISYLNTAHGFVDIVVSLGFDLNARGNVIEGMEVGSQQTSDLLVFSSHYFNLDKEN